MRRRREAPLFLDRLQAELCLELWSTKKFDTAQIASFLDVPEPAICRTIQAARDLARDQVGKAVRA